MQIPLPKLHPLTPVVTSVITRMPTEPATPGLHYYVNSKAEWSVDDVRSILSDCLRDTFNPVTFGGPRTSMLHAFERRLHEVGIVNEADRDRLYYLGYNVISRVPSLGVCLMDQYVTDGSANRQSPLNMADMYGFLRLLVDYSKFLRSIRFMDFGKPTHNSEYRAALITYFHEQMQMRSTLNLVSTVSDEQGKISRVKFNFVPYANIEYGFLWEGQRPHSWIVSSGLMDLLARIVSVWPDLFEWIEADGVSPMRQLVFNGEISFTTLTIVGDHQILDHS